MFTITKLRPAHDESYPPSWKDSNGRHHMEVDFDGHKWLSELPKKCHEDIHPIFLDNPDYFSSCDVWLYACFPRPEFTWSLRVGGDTIKITALSSIVDNRNFDTFYFVQKVMYQKTTLITAGIIGVAPNTHKEKARTLGKHGVAYYLYNQYFFSPNFKKTDWYYNNNEALMLMWAANSGELEL